MSFKNPRLYVIAEELNLQFENRNSKMQTESLQELKKMFPNVEDEDIQRFFALLEIQHELHALQNVQMEVVVTAPSEILNQRRTIGVLRESIENAKETILITGYSVSEFANEIIVLLMNKAREGVRIKFFIDKNVNTDIFAKATLNSNFELYKYRNSKINSSMHAKLIVIDDDNAFISSSNLSYNGIINNLEMGIFAKGKPLREFKDIFEELISKEYFVRIK
ncbi:hypothetical protein BBI11_15525 [Planococcus maritimus]|uniref:phospholipase D-like domain-containing protein n=1 Tax=Planococcus maritimus TaxID=192421 RepID=UPI00080F156E|nr:phospholipase D-like domain-containing protein [Planococcus maritimus]ANU18358.1 hypothetical protein BBI11_15525 [Planococcus maritimus]